MNLSIKHLLRKTALLLSSAAMFLSASAADGFHTSGTRLLDSNDKEFIMRGCNYSWAWQRGQEGSVIPAAKRIGCNSIRIQLATGRKWQRCSQDDLRRLIKLCEDNKLIAIFNTHDETGSDNYDDLDNACNFWIEMKDILNAHRNTVIVNISNEWHGTHASGPWAEGYLKAIPKLRNAGIKNTLVVDCAGWGQYPESIAQRGSDLIAADSEKNIVFSMHLYDYAGASENKVRNHIDNALAKGAPVIVGEFAYRHKGNDVAWQAVLDYTKEKNVGYLAWSWTGNGDGAEECDMFGGYDESYWKPNGEKLVKGRNGIKETAVECSVFGGSTEPDPVDPTPVDPTPGPGEITDDPAETEVYTGSHHFDSSWNNMLHITHEQLGSVTGTDIIRVYVSRDNNAQVQVAYATPQNGWNEFVKCADLNNDLYEIPLKNNELCDGVNYNGLFLKGQNYTVKKVTVYHTQSTVVDTIFDTDDNTIDFDMPCEIYTIDGRRVSEMTSGRIYIVRQGAKVAKIMK